MIDTEKTLEKVVSQSQITYDEIQLEAVRTAISSKVMILTGGPGTGKPLPHWVLYLPIRWPVIRSF